MIISNKWIYPFLLVFSWILCLFLPHFQETPTLLDLAFDSFLAAFLSNFLTQLLFRSNIFFKKKIFTLQFLVLSIFPIVFLLFEIGVQKPYFIWSRFGAGSMMLNGKIVPFGDLIHLTSAATCPEQPVVGGGVCDPWNRLLNQNPLIIELMKKWHLTNLTFLGISSFIFFASIILIFFIKLEITTFVPAVFLLSPPLVLAVDRGNEVITLLLVLSGLLFIGNISTRFSSFGAILLIFAVIFKLWPAVLVVALIVFSGKWLSFYTKILLSLSVFYWLFNMNTALSLLRATQHGSPFGNSFGLKLFWNSEMSLSQTLILVSITIFLSSYYLLRYPINIDSFKQDILTAKFGFFLVPVFISFVAIWAIGESFSYRVIVLLPAVLILSQKKLIESIWVKRLLQMILVTVLTARLPIFISVSSALAIYISIFIVKYLKFVSLQFREDLLIQTNSKLN